MEERTGNSGFGNVPSQGRPLTLAQTAWIKYTSYLLRFKPLWTDVHEFAVWFELEVAKMARRSQQEKITIIIDDNIRIQAGVELLDSPVDRYNELFKFLEHVNIKRIDLDIRLESNQIEDIFDLLYCYRIQLEKPEMGHSKRLIADLSSQDGIHIACTRTRLEDSALIVDYSYCTLRYSHLVHWFEQRNKNFRDHRTFFKSAPGFSLLITMLVTTVSIAYSIWTNQWILMLLLLSAAGVLFGLVYLFFMIMGSIEYDNEEKTYQLSRAYKQLKGYTEKINADIIRARTIQQSFLPADGKMPKPDNIDWAYSFDPADEVGGDYFDTGVIDENRIAVLFSDVCGHGMSAAFITAVLKTTFQDWLDDKSSLVELAKKLNSNLCRLTPVGSFAAVFLAIYNISSGSFKYMNFGHQPEPWLIPSNHANPVKSLSEAGSLIMGVEDNIDYPLAEIRLSPGDGIVLVSDGIVENFDPEGKQYGIERFEQFLQDNRKCIIEELVKGIYNETRCYADTADQLDDRTTLAFRVKKYT